MKLVLFFSRGLSLESWHHYGLVGRDSRLYVELVKRGVDVTFLTYGGPQEVDFAPPGIRVAFKPPALSAAQYRWRLPWVHEQTLNQAEVFKSHQVLGAAAAVVAKTIYHRPYVARAGYLHAIFHQELGSSRPDFWKTRAEEWLAFRQADLFCLPSQTEIDWVADHYGVEANRGRVCPNWIDTEMFRPQPEVVRHPRRIAFLARFEKQKRPFLVLEAARRLPNVELLFVGGGTLQKELEEKARQWDLKVTFLGRTPNEELPALLNSCALYVLPTMIEGGSPKTLLEAMACGLPVVTADSFGIKECFHHGKHGYRLSDLSPEAWSETIGALLDQPQLLTQMGRAARQHVVDHYSVQEAVRREIQVLEEAVALRR